MKSSDASRGLSVSLTTARILVGLLFIFSGLVKADDPLGLSYKMQEFFDAWNWHGWNDYTLTLAVLMIGFEIVAGVSLILGWQMRLFSWLLALLMLFFLFLTSYVLFSGKIKACGCFGDCIPLTPKQTFTKDVVLMGLILFIFRYRRVVKPALSSFRSAVVLTLTVLFCIFSQRYMLRHLPAVDCLPFREGNNLVLGMQMPADAIPDSMVMTFIYTKAGKRYAFTADRLPVDLGSYTFVDRIDRVVREGRDNEPPIKDFVLLAPDGGDSTPAVLQQEGNYYILFRKDFSEHVGGSWLSSFKGIVQDARTRHWPVVVVTGQRDQADALFNKQMGLGLPIYTCDVTAIKTAARTNPCLFLMKGPVVQRKWGYADFGRVPK